MMNTRCRPLFPTRLFPALLLFVAFVSQSLYSGVAFGQTPGPVSESGSSTVASGPETVKIGIYLLSGGKLDFQNTQAPLDFYLWMVFNGSATPKIEFLNSKNYNLSLQNDERPVPGSDLHYVVYRAFGQFEQDFDLTQFPFGLFPFKILIEDTETTARERVYEPDLINTGFDPLFHISGAQIGNFSLTVSSHSYKTNFGSPVQTPGDSAYSRVKLAFEASRSATIIFIKMILPVILFLSISLVGVFLPIEQIGQRISLCVGALFSSVAYHINIAQGLPPLGYLTLADKILLANYTLIFTNILLCITLYSANRMKWERTEALFNRIGRVLIPTAAIITYSLLLRPVF